MTLEEYKNVLKELALSNTQMVGLPASNAQKGVVVCLFREFCEEANVWSVFAMKDDVFRHEAMEMLWGHRSMKDLDMATVSVMIDELGSNAGGRWALTKKGRELLYLIMDELEETHPVQYELM